MDKGWVVRVRRDGRRVVLWSCVKRVWAVLDGGWMDLGGAVSRVNGV